MILAKLTQKAAINNVLDGLPVGEIKIGDNEFGFGGNLGIMLEPREGTRFGVTYRSEVEFDFEDVATLKGVGPTLSAALAATGVLGSQVDLDLSLPQAVMVSAYHELTDKLALMGNVGWQDWSEFGKSNVKVTSSTTTTFSTDRNFQDTAHVRIGAHYRIYPLGSFLSGLRMTARRCRTQTEHRMPPWIVSSVMEPGYNTIEVRM